MDSGYYAAFSGLLSRSEALDSVASNLANANTHGFRAEREYFRGAVTGPDAPNSQLNATVNNYGVLGGNQLDLGQGPLVVTGNPLDVAIDGQGFFALQTPQGIRYTRDGSFQRTNKGELIAATGEPVLNRLNKPIIIPTGQISIGTDGAVSVDGAVAGQIGVFKFRAPISLTPEGTNRYAPVNGEKPTVAAASTLHQGSLESSNQDVIQGTMQLILVQRQFGLMQKALSIFNSDFDKTASQDLPRV